VPWQFGRKNNNMPKMKDSKRMLLKTHVEKMSVSGLETMLMKTN
jgi:hypothetical protein